MKIGGSGEVGDEALRGGAGSGNRLWNLEPEIRSTRWNNNESRYEKETTTYNNVSPQLDATIRSQKRASPSKDKKSPPQKKNLKKHYDYWGKVYRYKHNDHVDNMLLSWQKSLCKEHK